MTAMSVSSDLLLLLAPFKGLHYQSVFGVNPFPKTAFGEAVAEVSQLTGAKQPGCMQCLHFLQLEIVSYVLLLYCRVLVDYK